MAEKLFALTLIACSVGISRHQYLGRPARLPPYDYFNILPRQLFGALPRISYGNNFQPYHNYRVSPWRINAKEEFPFPYSYFEEPEDEDSLILNRPEDESVTLLRSGFKKTKPVDEASGRFLYANVDNVGYNAEASANPLFGNPFVKTAFYYITSYITDTAFAKCVPSTLFLNFGAQQIPCRRKRDEAVLDRMSEAEGELDSQYVESSPVISVEHSIEPSLGLSGAELSLNFTPDHNQIQSSKEHTLLRELVNIGKAREKRFWYLMRNFFTVPTTVTTFIFTTTTYTSVIRLVATTDLTCLPVGYSICQF